MHFATLLGIGASLAVIVFSIGIQEGAASFFNTASLSLFFDFRSFLLVAGGTLSAAITQYPVSLVFGVGSVVSKALLGKYPRPQQVIHTMTDFSYRARRDGVQSLTPAIAEISDPFVHKGMQLAVDGLDPSSIRNILESEIDNMLVRHERGANVLESMATYAPALGMTGTVIGLVQMLSTMNDPSSIGPKMALALITTFYGVIFSNLIFLPLAGKLRLRSKEELFIMEMASEGIVAIAAGENPRLVQEKLASFQSPKDRQETKKWLEEV